MQRYVEIVMIEGEVVEVTVIAPDDANVLNVQELAEKAWRSINKQITIGGVTVKVRGFGRRR